MERQQQGNIPPLLFVILCSYDQIILRLSQDSQSVQRTMWPGNLRAKWPEGYMTR